MMDLAMATLALTLQALDLDINKHSMMELTTAVRDTTIVDRALAALEKGCVARHKAQGVETMEEPGFDIQQG
ncbi:BQ2448_4405 [Microbotryum intermedium]|uniref:BQ2448_4405 protein n=1 Tax=Microbotryum intermedium TaxID=269621 RepID=A0A238FNT5_9BASI|nr:BQ2448_4405 [Microbotryum intermedium]